MKREHTISFCTSLEGTKDHKTENLVIYFSNISALQDFFWFSFPPQDLWTFSSLRLECFPHSLPFDSPLNSFKLLTSVSLLERKEAPLSPSDRVNPIATCSHNSLYFPFLNIHLIVLCCVIFDSRDHTISSLPILRAWHRAWHLGGAQNYLLLPLNFNS